MNPLLNPQASTLSSVAYHQKYRSQGSARQTGLWHCQLIVCVSPAIAACHLQYSRPKARLLKGYAAIAN